MVNTIHDVLLPHRPHCPGRESLVAALYVADQLLGPQCLEGVLDLGEDQLDRVQLWTVAPVVDEPEAQLPHGLLRPLRLVRAELVHEQADPGLAIELPELGDPLDVLVDVDGPLEDLEMLQAILSGYAGKHGQRRLVELGLFDPRILPWQRPLRIWEGLAREHGLVEVHDAVAGVPGHGQLPFHSGQLLAGSGRSLATRHLEPLVPLLLDAVHLVDIPQQGRIHMAVRELAKVLSAAVLEGETRLVLEGLAAGDPLDLMLLEEAEAIVLSLMVSPIEPELLNQWELLPLDELEPGEDELPGLRPRDVEHLADGLVAGQGRMARVRHLLAPPQLDHICDLLVGESLHLFCKDQLIKALS